MKLQQTNANAGSSQSWNQRFKKTVAPHAHETKQFVSSEHRLAARELDPTSYLTAACFTCKKTHRSSTTYVTDGHGDEVYRVTLQADGHYVTCDKYGNGVGDNIALVMHVEPGKQFIEAVHSLCSPSFNVTFPVYQPIVRPAAVSSALALPSYTSVDTARGRAYLKGRGIDLQTIVHAEVSGFLTYTEKAVLFVGRDAKKTPRCATRRSVVKEDWIQKSDIAASDKRFPAVLRGDSKTIVIVDGGVDALALHTCALRRNKARPTVIVTGGVGMRSWIDQTFLQADLLAAERITICVDNEKDYATQARTDAHVAEMRRLVAAASLRSADSVKEYRFDPVRGKDFADINLQEVQQAVKNIGTTGSTKSCRA